MSAGEISPEVVERMAAHLRDVVKRFAGRDDRGVADLMEARAIVALLPEPVDPDLIEARETVCRSHHDKYPESPWHIGQAALVRAGNSDNSLEVQAAYHGIRRGRELAQGDRS